MQRRKRILRWFADFAFLALGVLSAGLGLRGFLLPNTFIDGGVTGVSLLITALSDMPLSILLLIINFPFVVLGYLQINRGASIRSALAISGLAVCVHFIPYPEVTHDRLLAAAFGGVFLGAGIGLSIRGGGVLDGTEIMALILSRRIPATVGDIILGVNVIIFLVAAVLLNIESALYSMLTYFSASKMVDFLLHGIESYNGVTIVSAKVVEIRLGIINELGRGVTIYKGKGGFTEREQEILFCVITRLEIPRIRNLVKNIDEAAFVVVHPVGDVDGGVLRRARHQSRA